MTKRFGVIFDFNGTLFLDSHKHAETFKALCHDYGIPEFSDEYIVKNIFGKNNRRIVLESFKPDATEEDIRWYDVYKETKYQELCLAEEGFMHLTKGACEFLDYLKENNIPYAIATGSPMINIEFYFKYLDLGKWFTMDNIVYDDGSFPCKPAPDIYLKAAEVIGLHPEDCIVFEDARAGILSANNANIGSVWAVIPQAYLSPVSDETKVDGSIADFTGYMEIIKKYL